MLYVNKIFNLSNGICILSCIKQCKYDFQIPRKFKLYIDFIFYGDVMITGIVMKKYDYLNETFNYVDVNCNPTISNDIFTMGRCVVLVSDD